MAENGLIRGENGLEIYVMCEIPNNVIQVEAFAEIFDVSIGSNDLHPVGARGGSRLGIGRFDYDERDEGVSR